MTAKEKAQELVEKMYATGVIDSYESIKCALIAVDEIIDAIDFDWMEVQNLERQHAYWQEVRQEIEKL